MTLSCTAPRQGHRPGSAAERACPKHGRQASREVSLPAAVAAPVSSDEPTVVTRYGDGTVRYEAWSVDGKRHRTDGPAYVWHHTDGSVEFEDWYVDGERHRDDGPAHVRYRPDGTVKWEKWYVNGKLHRDDGPAIECYLPTGELEEERWFCNDKPHRLDGPALIRHGLNGIPVREKWRLMGQDVQPRDVFLALIEERFGAKLSPDGADFLLRDRAWQEWNSIERDEVELVMTLYPNYAEA